MRQPRKVFGLHDERTLIQLEDVASRAERVALMADGHVGYVMPIGGVAAYRDQVSVVGVGFDIACGNAAIRTDLTLDDLCGIGSIEEARSNPHRVRTNRRLNKLADEIADQIAFGVGGQYREPVTDDPLFLDDAWYLIPNVGGFRDELSDKARLQLGSVGSGNHYIDVFADENSDVWVGVHFGSRGLGHTIATNFLAIGQGGTWGDRGREAEVLLDVVSTEVGRDYWALMTLAGRYAYAGREWVARRVTELMGGQEADLVHNHHNFAWRETHGGEELVVVRKGATPAWPGQRGFVGGSMGDDAVILAGADPDRGGVPELQAAALHSTVHGAGRVMGRTAARGKWRKGRQVQKGRVSGEMMDRWMERKGVVLRGGDLDEAPQVYRRLPDVLASQGPTVEVLHTLRPLIVCMAPSGTR